MAVQSQYPSNVIFLNRSVEEGSKHQPGHDYSLQPQPEGGGGFLDHHHHHSYHILFNNIGSSVATNPRKRGREDTIDSLVSMQPQHPQLIDLNHQHQHHGVSTGLQLSFGDRQQQLQQLHTLSSQSSSILSQEITTEIKRHRDQIDNFLQAQGEQLRHTLAEKRQGHYRALLIAAEESAARRMRERDLEVEIAARRQGELEARASQLCAEAQVWRERVAAQETAAANLQARLLQAIKSRGQDGCTVGEEDAESAYVDPERVTLPSGPGCKACGKRVASVVVLPCRHLCICTECDVVIQACPLCLSFRESSIEVSVS